MEGTLGTLVEGLEVRGWYMAGWRFHMSQGRSTPWSLGMGDRAPPLMTGILIMGPYKPLRTWVDEFIPHYMEIMGVDRPDRTYCSLSKGHHSPNSSLKYHPRWTSLASSLIFEKSRISCTWSTTPARHPKTNTQKNGAFLHICFGSNQILHHLPVSIFHIPHQQS